MSNGRRIHRDHDHRPPVVERVTPPDGRLKRVWWRCKRWLGVR